MDRPTETDGPGESGAGRTPPGRGAAQGRRRITRRKVLRAGVAAAAGAGAAGGAIWYLVRHFSRSGKGGEGVWGGRGDLAGGAEKFSGDAPPTGLWDAWNRRGWVKEAYHYSRRGADVQCQVCPNQCVLSPGDRSHCRNKVNKDGRLYTLAYADPCTFHVDPIEKKPLFHFHPGTRSFSLATAGCVFRCLNCQNWEISQRSPEETKDASGPERRLTAPTLGPLSMDDVRRLSLLPEDIAGLARALDCPSISYTYSEPIAYSEYACDCCKQARAGGIRNVLVTCGYIRREPLRDLARHVDAAHVDLKGFDEDVYRKLNSGRLAPVLDTLTTLKEMGVWVEVVNLVVPTYTDDIEVIKRMCGWLVEKMGPDCPVHFSRFMPLHKLTHLSPTPAGILVQARAAAQAAGLRYVYIGNVPGLEGAGTTFCPSCRRPVVERDVFAVTAMNLVGGKCKACGTRIAGVWA
jgi:pyruvate formate lyase activating enzyme